MKARQNISRSPAETRTVAGELAQTLPDGTVVALCGTLGSGKTCFVQGMALALGVAEPVTSPTFALVHQYAGRRALCHVDLYRIAEAADLDGLGLDDCLDPAGLAAFEWADRAPDLFPPGTVWVHLSMLPGRGRRRIAVTLAPPPPA